MMMYVRMKSMMDIKRFKKSISSKKGEAKIMEKEK